MRIALDAMGGDHAPCEIVHGAVEAASKPHSTISRILLVGDEKAIRAELEKYPKVNMERIAIIHAPENINMDESPATAVRKKKQCSINVCMDLINGKRPMLWSLRVILELFPQRRSLR